jgi:hypothetical protein
VQVDCDSLSKAAKKEIFSSTRDRMKETELTESIRAEVRRILKSDVKLKKILDEIREESLKTVTDESIKRVNSELDKLIKQWELKEDQPAKHIAEQGQGTVDLPPMEKITQAEREKKEMEDDITEEEPIDETLTLLDIPTEFEIVAKDPIEIPLGKTYVLRMKTNAKDYFLTERNKSALEILFSDNILVEKSRSQLRNGVITSRVLAKEGISVGSSCELTARLKLDTDKYLQDKRKVIVVEPKKRKYTVGKAPQPPKHSVIPVTEGDPNWLRFQWTNKNVAEVDAAGTGTVLIYVSMSNEDYIKQLNLCDVSSSALKKYQHKYMTAIAFHAWLQEKGEQAKDASPEVLQEELRRAVRTVLYTTFVAPEID